MSTRQRIPCSHTCGPDSHQLFVISCRRSEFSPGQQAEAPRGEAGEMVRLLAQRWPVDYTSSCIASYPLHALLSRCPCSCVSSSVPFPHVCVLAPSDWSDPFFTPRPNIPDRRGLQRRRQGAGESPVCPPPQPPPRPPQVTRFLKKGQRRASLSSTFNFWTGN